MAEPRKATVRLVRDTELPPKVAEIFRDIQETKGIQFVPNFWRTLANSPDLLESVWTRLKSLMHPERVGRQSRLEPLTREIIALSVSVANNCSY